MGARPVDFVSVVFQAYDGRIPPLSVLGSDRAVAIWREFGDDKPRRPYADLEARIDQQEATIRLLLRGEGETTTRANRELAALDLIDSGEIDPVWCVGEFEIDGDDDPVFCRTLRRYREEDRFRRDFDRLKAVALRRYFSA